MNARAKIRLEKTVPECNPSDPFLSDSAYGQRWIIYCSCGTTVFGNSEEEARRTYQLHREGRL